MRKLASALIVLLACSAFAEENTIWEQYKGRFYESAMKFIKFKNAEKEMLRWNEDMDERVQSRSFTTIVIDWFFDNEKALSSQNEKKMKEAAFIFIRFYKTGENPPWQIKDRITDQSMESLLKYLDTQMGQ